MKDSSTVLIGAVVAIAVTCVAGYAATRLARAAPARLVRALLALAVVLGAIPAILYALYSA